MKSKISKLKTEKHKRRRKIIRKKRKIISRKEKITTKKIIEPNKNETQKHQILSPKENELTIRPPPMHDLSTSKKDDATTCSHSNQQDSSHYYNNRDTGKCNDDIVDDQNISFITSNKLPEIQKKNEVKKKKYYIDRPIKYELLTTIPRLEKLKMNTSIPKIVQEKKYENTQVEYKRNNRIFRYSKNERVSTIWIGGLNKTIHTEKLIRETFSKIGKIRKISLYGEFAFIQFYECSDATKARQKHHNKYIGKDNTVRIQVHYSRSTKKEKNSYGRNNSHGRNNSYGRNNFITGYVKRDLSLDKKKEEGNQKYFEKSNSKYYLLKRNDKHYEKNVHNKDDMRMQNVHKKVDVVAGNDIRYTDANPIRFIYKHF